MTDAETDHTQQQQAIGFLDWLFRVTTKLKRSLEAASVHNPIAMKLCLFGTASLLFAAYCLLPIAAEERARLSIYAPQARYSVSITTLDSQSYVSVVELLEPLTTSQLRLEGTKWRLRIPDPKTAGRIADAEFQEGSAAAMVRGMKILLSGPARGENGRLMLPLHGIGSVLIPLLGTDVSFHEASQRMFLGGTAAAVSFEIRSGEPSTLALRFGEAVNPNIHSERNSLVLSFTRDPVVSYGDAQAFSDKLFTSSTFAEKNGTATLTINANAPLLAKFADGGKTILISAAPAPPEPPAASPNVAQQLPDQTAAPMPPPIESPTSAPVPEVQPARHPIQPPSFIVVIDPAHGGSDPGARIAPNVLEKDLTLSMARRLRQELQTRHVAVSLLRDSDTDVPLDQRAVAANLARPSLFVSVHAEPGTWLRIYTAALPVTSDVASDRNSFLPWQSAQGAFTGESASFAAAAAQALGKRQLRAQVRPAFVQPLHSIAAAAIAIEAPAGPKGLNISEEQITSALADAVLARKGNVGLPQ